MRHALLALCASVFLMSCHVPMHPYADYLNESIGREDHDAVARKMGAPHRAKYFRKIYEKIRKKRDVLFWTGSQIADWYTKVGPKPA